MYHHGTVIVAVQNHFPRIVKRHAFALAFLVENLGKLLHFLLRLLGHVNNLAGFQFYVVVGQYLLYFLPVAQQNRSGNAVVHQNLGGFQDFIGVRFRKNHPFGLALGQ